MVFLRVPPVKQTTRLRVSISRAPRRVTSTSILPSPCIAASYTPFCLLLPASHPTFRWTAALCPRLSACLCADCHTGYTALLPLCTFYSSLTRATAFCTTPDAILHSSNLDTYTSSCCTNLREYGMCVWILLGDVEIPSVVIFSLYILRDNVSIRLFMPYILLLDLALFYSFLLLQRCPSNS